jgi:hypothetical protein
MARRRSRSSVRRPVRGRTGARRSVSRGRAPRARASRTLRGGRQTVRIELVAAPQGPQYPVALPGSSQLVLPGDPQVTKPRGSRF